MSGVDLPNGTKVRKGAAEAIEQYVKALGGTIPSDLHEQVNKISSLGGTPLTVCENDRILGVIYLKDTVKPGMVERLSGCVRLVSKPSCAPAIIHLPRLPLQKKQVLMVSLPSANLRIRSM